MLANETLISKTEAAGFVATLVATGLLAGCAPEQEPPLPLGTAGQRVEATIDSSRTITISTGCGRKEVVDAFRPTRFPYGYARALAVVPGSLLGVPDAPNLLAVDCPATDSPNQILLIDPEDGSNPRIVPLDGGGDWMGFAFRADRSDMLALSVSAPGAGYDVYRITMADVDPVFGRDAAPGSTELLFSKPGELSTEKAIGLGWDAVTKTVSVLIDLADVSDPSDVEIRRFDAAGTPIDVTPIPMGNLQPSLNHWISPGGTLASGDVPLVVRNWREQRQLVDETYITVDEVHILTVSSGGVDNPGDAGGIFVSDIECDSETPAPPGKALVWGLTLDGAEIQAFEVPQSACESGGAEPYERQNLLDPVTGQPSSALTAVCGGFGQLGSPLEDLDRDGLLDCWELLGGIDWDLDGTLDYYWPAGMAAVPGRQDFYVEIDYMQAHQPPLGDIQRVQQAFNNAPLTGFAPLGRALHVQIDEELGHADTITFGSCSDAEPTIGVPDFDLVKRQHFGTLVEQTSGSADEIRKRLNAKRGFFRYNIWAHGLAGAGDASGCASAGGDDFLVSLGGGDPAHVVLQLDEYAGTFMHELGHTLGLWHGGARGLPNRKPNYPSVMSYSFQFQTYVRDRVLDYSQGSVPEIFEGGLQETAGLPYFPAGTDPLAAQTVVFLNCNVATGQPPCNAQTIDILPLWVDWNANSIPDLFTLAPLDVNGNLDNTETLRDHDDWSAIHGQFRNGEWIQGRHIELVVERVDPVAQDIDEDGVFGRGDNCPTVNNPDQLDSNADGIGDACHALIGWTMFRQSAQRTGSSLAHTVFGSQLRWTRRARRHIYSSAGISPTGTVYVGDSDKHLYALSAEGRVLWRGETGGKIVSSPAIAPDGSVYVGAHDGRLYAFDSSGQLLWHYQTGNHVDSSPAIGPNGDIYIGSDDGFLYALSPGGALLWRYKTGGQVDSSPALGPDGTLYVGSSDGILYAIDDAGKLLWRAHLGREVDSSPALGEDGNIYVGSSDGRLHALSPDGRVLWQFVTGGPVLSSPAVRGWIFVGSNDGTLYALRPDGELLWEYHTGGPVRSSPAVSNDGFIYFGSDDGRVYALRSDGTLLWSYQTGKKVSASPAIAFDGTVVVGSEDKTLYAFGSGPR